MSCAPVIKTKDPSEDLDYTWDFTSLLASSETISSHSFPSVPSGITMHDDAAGTTAVTAWVSGGTADTTYDVPCRIVTNSSPPRTFERTIRFRICEK